MTGRRWPSAADAMYEWIVVTACSLIPVNAQVLRRRGRVVYIGQVGDPIEDAVFDEILMNPADIERMIGCSEGTAH